ncbi:MAG: dihydrofolate reductase [Candidatus Omnitrophica bacterium]|nr:dihydrofolate reductase [Candidatus Omnitrophota bacterium]
MTVSIIVAVSQNGVIGANNKLPWHLPADLKRFKQLTLGHPVIMGRKTFESIGKPLPGRTNIVVTSRKDYPCCGALTAPSLQEALRICEEKQENRVFVIGGASIYKQAEPLADEILLTLIREQFQGDATFQWNRNLWREAERSDHPADEKNRFPYSFIRMERIPASQQRP